MVASISSKKRTKTRRIVVKTNSFVRFLEEFTAWQFAFEINWPLKNIYYRKISVEKFLILSQKEIGPGIINDDVLTSISRSALKFEIKEGLGQFEVYFRVQLTLRIQRWLNGLRYLQQTQGCHQWELYKHNFQRNHKNHNNINLFLKRII